MKLAIIGAGMMARAVAHQLLRRPEVTELRVGDRDPARRRAFRACFPDPRLRLPAVDAGVRRQAEKLICGCDVAVSCAPYPLNLRLTETALACGAHFCDLGGNNDVVRAQLGRNARARRAGVTVVPDCGLAPGLVSIIAADALERLDRCDAIRLRVGGLPRRPVPPLDYAIVFSAHGLVNEYAEPCAVLRRGRRRTVPPLADRETLRFPAPFGKLEAFNTSGGSSTLPWTLHGRVRELDYKTIRYPGHCDRVRLLFQLGLASTVPVRLRGRTVVPRELLIRQLEAALGFTTDDVVLLRAEAEGQRAGRRVRLRYQLIDYADRRTGLTAMMRCTGFPAALAALALGRGQAKRAGVVPGELAFAPGPYLAGLADCGLRLTRRSGRA